MHAHPPRYPIRTDSTFFVRTEEEEDQGSPAHRGGEDFTRSSAESLFNRGWMTSRRPYTLAGMDISELDMEQEPSPSQSSSASMIRDVRQNLSLSNEFAPHPTNPMFALLRITPMLPRGMHDFLESDDGTQVSSHKRSGRRSCPRTTTEAGDRGTRTDLRHVTFTGL